MDMHAFMDELEARFDEVRSRELEELIDELTDAERASVTLSARLAGADGLINLALRGGSVLGARRRMAARAQRCARVVRSWRRRRWARAA